jgi:tetratricopeptide (TPR) repeat protein
MSSNEHENIQDLLLEGLRLFGIGEVERANAHWRKILDIDEDHETATDYLTNSALSLEDDAGETLLSAQTVLDGKEESLHDMSTVNENIISLIKERRFEESFLFLEYGQSQLGNEKEDFVRLKKRICNLLTLKYVNHLGSLSQELKSVGDPHVIENMSSKIIKVFALIDGNGYQHNLTIGDLLTVSMYKPFDTLRALVQLQHHGHIELRDPDEDSTKPEISTTTSDLKEPESTSLSKDGSPPDDDAKTFSTTVDEEVSTDSVQVDEESYEAIYRTAVQKYVQGEFTKARTLFKECAARRPDDPRPKTHMDQIDTLQE